MAFIDQGKAFDRIVRAEHWKCLAELGIFGELLRRRRGAGRRWTWRSPDGNTKNEIDYTMTDKPSMVTDVTVINRVNIGSDHRMAMGSITLNTRAERRKLLNKNTRTRVDTQMIGTKKNMFQLELKKQVHSTRRT